MLQQEFMNLVSRHSANNTLAVQLWQELETAYSEPKRAYHNLSHLEQMLTLLQPFKSTAEDWDTLLFALFYHDVVYSITPHILDSNEGLSAKVAGKALSQISYPSEKKDRCKRHILATQKHELFSDNDTNLLTDADLAILGQPWIVYEVYSQNMRKEYSIYPDLIYKPGRAKALRHFLLMNRLYKTDFFYSQYEARAKENIERELALLTDG